MRNKMFYRYAQKELCSITSAGQKELHNLLISYDFPMSFESEFVNFILHSDATINEKLIRAREVVAAMNEAKRSALTRMLDNARIERDERQAWKDAEEQRIEYNRQQQALEDHRKQRSLSVAARILVAATLLCVAYVIFGVN